MAFPFQPDPMLGRVIEGHQVQATLGRGNMGACYRAVPIDGGPPVALKVLQRALVREPELVERFQREFQNATRVVHPNVVRTLGTGLTEDGIPWLMTEFLEGTSLADRIASEGRFPCARACAIATQLADGLGAAHAVGVVHRDLKPENVMIGDGDRATLFDFGLARADMPNQPALTAADLRVGTPMYMAPEYIARGQLDPRSDLYALGIVLFELCTGALPFDGPPFKVLHHHVTRPAPTLRSRAPELPDALDALVASLLEKDPDARPQTADAVAQRLRAWS